MDTKFTIKIGFAVILFTFVNFLIDFALGSTSILMYYRCQFISNILIGLIFSIIGGIAPLIIPGAEMPTNIRLGHGFEVGISNFLYGLALGYLHGQKPKNKK